MSKAKNTAAAADDEVEIIEDMDDEVEVDAAAAASADEAESADEVDDDEADIDDDDSDPVKLERKRKRQAQSRARAAERRAQELEERLRRLEEMQAEAAQREQASELERRKGTIVASVSAAEQALRDAYEDGDTDKIVKAQRQLSRAEAEAARIEQEAERPKPARPAASAPAANTYRDAFIAKHQSWFDPTLTDKDSRRVAELSARLASEGVDPRSSYHFKLLEEIARDELPHRFQTAKARPRQATASPSAGRMNGDSKAGKALPITRAQVAAFKQGAGLDWDHPDETTRNEHRAQIKQYIRESRQARGVDA